MHLFYEDALAATHFKSGEFIWSDNLQISCTTIFCINAARGISIEGR
jgi:hypothetical protein